MVEFDPFSQDRALASTLRVDVPYSNNAWASYYFKPGVGRVSYEKYTINKRGALPTPEQVPSAKQRWLSMFQVAQNKLGVVVPADEIEKDPDGVLEVVQVLTFALGAEVEVSENVKIEDVKNPKSGEPEKFMVLPAEHIDKLPLNR